MIDVYGDFLTYWSATCLKSIERQIDFWHSSYMSKYPELLRKQIEEYRSKNLDWRRVAGEKGFSETF
ncbi:MAG: hypothetical protein ACUVQ0_01290 [Thermoproteota archaeon]